ncbi:hypothetical protein HE1_00224 [Holospora elegans E1]|uniref:Tc1-like transposase DDE domain-containing protein n=2 Tax=Holospora TaxID=44747 RepID=A0A023DYP4_9PROT|nr:hypothetical protein HE1_00224 [Holospora elegans E1]
MRHALDLTSMRLTVVSLETLNSATMKTFFDQMKDAYSKAPNIHLILDQGPYNTSKDTKKAAKEIQESKESAPTLAKDYILKVKTVLKCKKT